MIPILYLHGFLSSPQSIKAQQALAYVRQHLPEVKLIVPQIPNTIDLAIPFITELVERDFIQPNHELRCIGSSMGGFLSNVLVEKFGGRAVLVNPAVAPYSLMQQYIGSHQNPYTQEQFSIEQSHVALLRDLEKPIVNSPRSYRVLLQTGDEVLDYQLAVERYAGADIIIEQGGDHSFKDFAQHLESLFGFLLK